MIASLDFETRSGTDIKLGLCRYLSDPDAAVLCLAWAMDDGEVQLWVPGDPDPAPLLDHIRAGRAVRGWNVAFEHAVWNRLCQPMGWPELFLDQCIDTMAQAAVCNLPQSLGECAQALGLPQDQQKDKRGRYLIQRLCKPHPPTKTRPGRWINDPALLAELYAYCRQDVVAERALAHAMPELTDMHERRWLLTQRINQRGLPVATDEIARIGQVIEQEKTALNCTLRQISGVPSASRRDELLTWVRGQGVDIPDLTGETVEAVLTTLPDGPARQALAIRARVCQTSTAKFDKMLEIVCEDGTIKGLLAYHGASTGRYASRGGLNAQNLPRPPIDDTDTCVATLAAGDWGFANALFGDLVMDAAVSAVRGVIKAPAGYEFLDADFSSVENRVSAWIAGQQDKVDDFAAGKDEYKTFASSMYEIPYAEVSKQQRQVAKSAVLGGMFGQGWKGLIDYATTYGVTLDEDRSRFLIDTYRAQYPKVQALWYRCGDKAIEAVRHPGIAQVINGKLRLLCDGEFLKLKLPSGRVLYWYDPEVEMMDTPWGARKEGVSVMGVNQITRKWQRQKLIGSSIFQSSVQGTALDLLINGVENVERAGYPVVLLVHDEILSLVPQGSGDEDDFGERMCTPPAWAHDIPLAYEAWRGIRFRK